MCGSMVDIQSATAENRREKKKIVTTASKYTVSQKMSHVWLVITLTRMNAFWYFFGRNVKWAVKRRFTMPPQIPANLANGKHKKTHFSLKCSIGALLKFNQSLLISSMFLSHIHASVWLLNLVSMRSDRDCWGTWFRRKEVDSAGAVGLHCTHNALVCCLLGFLFHKVMLKH